MIITGATGLLGSEIIRLSPHSKGLSSSDADLTDPSAVKILSSHLQLPLVTTDCPSVLIHCAARVGGVKANTERVAEFYDDNERMNANVMEAARIAGCKLVSAMSSCIYPDAGHVTYPLTEDQLHAGPPHPSNFGYAYSKRMLDVRARAYRQQWGCNFVNVIPNNLYGPNDNYDLEGGHVIPALIRRFHEAKLLDMPSVTLWGSGRPLREFTFARDAARIILWVAENYNEPEPINIGNPEEISIYKLAEMIRDLTGYKGSIGWDLNKPEGQYRKPTSNHRLRKLGWNGEYTPLLDGLRETVQSFISEYPNVRGVTSGA